MLWTTGARANDAKRNLVVLMIGGGEQATVILGGEQAEVGSYRAGGGPATVGRRRGPGQAVADLANVVVGDLFGVGLTLHGALPHVSGAGELRVRAAIDEVDRMIRAIRDVTFGLAERDGPDGSP